MTAGEQTVARWDKGSCRTNTINTWSLDEILDKQREVCLKKFIINICSDVAPSGNNVLRQLLRRREDLQYGNKHYGITSVMYKDNIKLHNKFHVGIDFLLLKLVHDRAADECCVLLS